MSHTLDEVLAALDDAGLLDQVEHEEIYDQVDQAVEDVESETERPFPEKPWRVDGPLFNKLREIAISHEDSNVFKTEHVPCNIKLNAIDGIKLMHFVVEKGHDLDPQFYPEVERVLLAIADGIGNGMSAYRLNEELKKQL